MTKQQISEALKLVTDHNPPITRLTLLTIGVSCSDAQAAAVNRLVDWKILYALAQRESPDAAAELLRKREEQILA